MQNRSFIAEENADVIFKKEKMTQQSNNDFAEVFLIV